MNVHISLLSFSFALLLSAGTCTTIFTFTNHCNYTIWPATNSGTGAVVADGGFLLPPGSTAVFPAPPGWSGRFWARTGCVFDNAGNGRCTTGDCGGRLRCAVGGEPPVSLAEFTIGGEPPVSLAEFTIGGGQDFYVVSLVDGFNVGVGVRPSGGSGDCRITACAADVLGDCPRELQVPGDGTGAVVACKSACLQFGTPEFCCSGDHTTPATCGPTVYSRRFKELCPTACTYAYDDKTSTFTCSGADYTVSFCPTGD
ncbi:hypothetical protein ACP275_02G133700 [Erythranthe tilingii]